MMLEAGLKPAKGVSQVYYGSVEQRLDNVADLAARIGDLIIATNSAKGKQTPPTRPQPRPSSMFGRLKHEGRLAKHRELTARLLPNGPQPAPERRVAGGRRRDTRLLDGTAVVAAQGTQAFVKPGVSATREEERSERWKARAQEVGRVPQSSDPAT